jgi:hypothetical protein
MERAMKTIAKATTAALFLLAVSPSAQAQQQGVELGMLECTISGGIGMIVSSKKELTCSFRPADQKFVPEAYVGTVTKYGLDIGATGKAVMQWLVLAPSADIYAPGALAGNYVGASAEASAAVGGGANFLVGGSNQTVTLQPVSVQAQTGLNLAIGVTQFALKGVVAVK